MVNVLDLTSDSPGFVHREGFWSVVLLECKKLSVNCCLKSFSEFGLSSKGVGQLSTTRNKLRVECQFSFLLRLSLCRNFFNAVEEIKFYAWHIGIKINLDIPDVFKTRSE